MFNRNPVSTIAIGFLLLAVSGCDKRPADLAATANFAAAAPMMEAAGRGGAPNQTDTLAYEHTVEVEIPRELLNARTVAIQNACRNDAVFGCSILDVSVRADDYYPSANVRLRLARGGVDSFIESASREARIRSRSTHAEDLAQPVADTERQLALLTIHRDRLEELMRNRNLSVDQLITVSKELASVQSQVDQFSTTHANLRRRIDTDLLTLSFVIPAVEMSAAQTPVWDALRSFWTRMKQAFAEVISFIAIVVPWLIVLLPALFGLRWVWRCAGRWLQRRQSGAPSV